MDALEKSHVVEELRFDCRQLDLFPVLIGTHVAHFHDVSGGYDRSTAEHVVKFIHRVQGPDSPSNVSDSKNIEAHVGENFYNFDVSSVGSEGDYPDTDYKLVVRADDYMKGPQSFSKALTADIDKRETRVER